MNAVGSLTLADGPIELEIRPDLGGKVTALRCLRHGRQWLAERDERLPPSADGKVYGPGEAWGWDELFPTVLPGRGTPPPWRGPLRDHGDLWGRPWEMLAADPRSVTLACGNREGGWRFERQLVLDGPAVDCRYRLRNEGEVAFPFLWSMHPIFALREEDRLTMDGVEAVRATISDHSALPEAPATIGWPVHERLRLDEVRPADKTFLKLYATPPDGQVRVVGGECELELRTDVDFAPHIGIYVNFGAWPESGLLHQVGLEPTTAPEDDLAAVVAGARPAELGPGEERTWQVRVVLH